MKEHPFPSIFDFILFVQIQNLFENLQFISVVIVLLKLLQDVV
jgi:hypothetical protein